MSLRDGRLVCDWHCGTKGSHAAPCTGPVTHLDEKGYVYCEGGAANRRGYCRIRKLRPAEAKRLAAGQPLKSY